MDNSRQFGALLDENAGSKFDNIGLNAMANADKAGRNRWVVTAGLNEHDGSDGWMEVQHFSKEKKWV